MKVKIILIITTSIMISSIVGIMATSNFTTNDKEIHLSPMVVNKSEAIDPR